MDRDNDVWEISHDFVAKLFENVIGNWRRRLLRVLLPILTPLLLIVWLVIMVFGVPAWENRRLIELVSGAQGTIQEAHGWLRISIPDTNALPDIIRQIVRTRNVEGLDLSETQVTDGMLAQLQHIDSLRVLNLNETDITDLGLSHVSKLTQLQELYLRDTKITDAGVPSLSALSQLRILVLGGTTGFRPRC